MKKGFSLVELSIVLVILGLLVGGILAGQALIRAAELRSVVRDVGNHKTAIFAFMDKYRGMPGDITNATAFWPAARNGNGDGKIQYSNGREELSLWQQLSLSGLVEGQYTGNYISPNVNVLGVNTPRSAIANVGYNPQHQDFNTYITTIYGMSGRNLLILAAMSSNGNLEESAVNPGDAYTIDGKMDDGYADKGQVRSGPQQSASAGQNKCTTALMSAASGDYLLASADIGCRMFFVIN